jgi:hypothetical protein
MPLGRRFAQAKRDEYARGENNAMQMQRESNGTYSLQTDVVQDDREASSLIQPHYIALPSAMEQARVLHARIMANDRQAVRVIERIPAWLTKLTDEDRERALQLKREHWISPEHRASLEKLARIAYAVETVCDRAERVVGEFTGESA